MERQDAAAKRAAGSNGVATAPRRPDDRQQGPSPPDGGTRAWLVMVASFFCNGIIFGVLNSYSTLLDGFKGKLEGQNVTDATSKAGLVGSLAMGTTFLVSSVSGVLTDIVGIQIITLLGGAIASGGFFLSSFAADCMPVLYLTFGVMVGLGGALAYTPSLAILGHYFKRRMGVVNGVVTAGSSVFTVVMPKVIGFFLGSSGVEWTLRVLAAIAAGIMLCATLFRPAGGKVRSKKVKLKDAFNVSIWRNRRYVVWAVVIPLSLFGYFVPYVYMNQFVAKNFPEASDAKLPVMCIGVTSGLGRLLFGYIADLPRVDRILLQQISFFSIGALTLLLPTVSGYFGWLVAISLAMGLFDGCFISLLGPIAFDICGREGATQAIGFLLGLCSLPLTVGPYVAGLLYERYDSYDLAFRLAGIPPILGAAAMFSIGCVGGEQHRNATKEDDRCQQVPLRKCEEGRNGQLAGTETEVGGEREED